MGAFDDGVLFRLLRERWAEEHHRARGGLLSCAGPLDRRRMGPWDRSHRWYWRPLVVWHAARLASHASERLLHRFDAHAPGGRCSHVHGLAVSSRLGLSRFEKAKIHYSEEGRGGRKNS